MVNTLKGAAYCERLLLIFLTLLLYTVYLAAEHQYFCKGLLVMPVLSSVSQRATAG